MIKTSRIHGIPRRHTVRTGLAMLALVAALSACGSNDKEKAPEQSETPTQSATPTPSNSTSATPS